jgi:transposase-like protein
MVRRYEVSDLDVEDIIVFAPNAHLDLGYTPYPSLFELEQEILAGVHTNSSGEIGCPACGCIDLFLKERTAKGVRYRCMSCMYATESEFESVKSRKDITLAQFGLGFECAICGEDIDSYNHDTVMRHVRKCRQKENENFSAENMMLELGQQDPDDPNRMWGPDIISPIFPFKGYERPTEEVRADLQKHLVGMEIRMYGPQNESEALGIRQPMDWWKDIGFSEFQPAGTMGRVTGVSMSNPNQPKIIGVWVTIISGGTAKHPVGSRVWFHVKDSYFPDSMRLGWTRGDYVGNPDREEYLRRKGVTKGFEAPYQPSQTLLDYSPEMLKYSSAVTGDFFWDSLKFGQSTRNAEEIRCCKECDKTTGLTTIQAGTYCYDCLPINLGAEDRSDYRNYLNDLRTYPELQNFSDEQLLAMGIDCLALETANREKKYSSEDNQSDDLIWDEEAGLFYDYVEVPQPDGELIVVYWILNEELDQVGKAQISIFNDNLEIDSIFIEPYYQRRGIATSFVNHVVNYWDSELLRFSDAVSDEGVAFIDSFAAEDNYDSTYGVKQAKIRRRLKKKIKKQAIMGTKAGQWSARKSQELKRQYEAACQRAGLKPYKGQKTKKQQDLTDWSDQRWRTASGKKSSTTGEPYFPAKAVAALKQKGLYSKAKKQKQAATKAGKQNARYSDDIRKVVKQYRSENMLNLSINPFEDVKWEDDESLTDRLRRENDSWREDIQWKAWELKPSKLSKTFIFEEEEPWIELWNLVFFSDALAEASGVDIESVVKQNKVIITIDKTTTPLDFVLLEYINEYMRL